ncbi:MAG: diguanylate cyclase [Nitrospirae bacterium]|nr:diguanylate cyclase [Nitrospirota bacterium]
MDKPAGPGRDDELIRLAHTDPLTNTFNRRYLEAKLQEEFRRARRDRASLALVLLDVDHFKLYNDTLGNAWGDRLLQRLAEVIQSQLEQTDLLCRYGGDEFAVLLPGRDLKSATSYAKNLLRAISGGRYPGHELFDALYSQGRLTASIGVAAIHPRLEHETDLIAWADYAVYRAKRAGRNQVIAQDGPPHTSDSRRQPLKLFETLAGIFSKADEAARKLQQTVTVIQDWLGVDVCSLYLHEAGDLVLRATVGLHPESVGRVRMSPSEGLTGLAVQTLTMICAPDAARHPRYKYFPETGEERFASYLGVPILYEARPLGVIVVQTRAMRDFSDEETSTVRAIAGLLGGFLVPLAEAAPRA